MRAFLEVSERLNIDCVVGSQSIRNPIPSFISVRVTIFSVRIVFDQLSNRGSSNQLSKGVNVSLLLPYPFKGCIEVQD